MLGFLLLVLLRDKGDKSVGVNSFHWGIELSGGKLVRGKVGQGHRKGRYDGGKVILSVNIDADCC